MGKEYTCWGQVIDVLHAEATHVYDTGSLIYSAMCRCGNGLLFICRSIDPAKIREDHVCKVLHNIDEKPRRYAMDCFGGEAPVFVAALCANEDSTCYFLFKEYDIKPLQEMDANDVMRWLVENSASIKKRDMYVELIAGEQVELPFG